MAWKDYAYAFYTCANCINDLEFLQLVCNEFSWHLYAEENKKGTNYMISGNTFVIDIFYERGEEGVQQEYVEDTQSMGSSVIQIGKERVESICRVIKKVEISLIEEEWSSYFRICTFSIMYYMKNKEYYSIYKLLQNIQKYDKEEEAEGFGSIIKRLKKMAENGSASVDYSFLLHKPVRYHKMQSNGKLYRMLGLFSYIEPDYTYKLYNLSRVEDIQEPRYIEIIIEMMIYNINIAIKENIVIKGKIEDTDHKIEINPEGYILVNGEVDTYRTLLLKRTESMYHVIRETGIEVAEYTG